MLRENSIYGLFLLFTFEVEAVTMMEERAGG